MNNMDLNKYAKVIETACWLEVNPATVREVVYQDEFPAIAIGKGWFIERAVLIEKSGSTMPERSTPLR